MYIALVVLIGLALVIRPEGAVFFAATAVGVLVVLVPAAYALYFWWIVRSKENSPLYEERTFEFDEDWLRVQMSDGTKSKLSWERVIKARKLRSNVLLYISKNQFLLVDLNAFRSDQDLEAFHQVLHTQELALQ
ncbi:MAG: YcxB family protein [Anaerolineales bacterium]